MDGTREILLGESSMYMLLAEQLQVLVKINQTMLEQARNDKTARKIFEKAGYRFPELETRKVKT